LAVLARWVHERLTLTIRLRGDGTRTVRVWESPTDLADFSGPSGVEVCL
jgi:hypothetical protein